MAYDIFLHISSMILGGIEISALIEKMKFWLENAKNASKSLFWAALNNFDNDNPDLSLTAWALSTGDKYRQFKTHFSLKIDGILRMPELREKMEWSSITGRNQFLIGAEHFSQLWKMNSDTLRIKFDQWVEFNREKSPLFNWIYTHPIETGLLGTLPIGAYLIADKILTPKQRLNQYFIIYKWTYTDPITLQEYVYIGKTVLDFTNRVKHHFEHIRKESKFYLYNAIKVHGLGNFRLEIIQLCNSIEHLDAREVYYIDTNNSYGEGGYNLTEGGDGSLKVRINWEKVSVLLDAPFYFSLVWLMKYGEVALSFDKDGNPKFTCDKLTFLKNLEILKRYDFDMYRSISERLQRNRDLRRGPNQIIRVYNLKNIYRYLNEYKTISLRKFLAAIGTTKDNFRFHVNKLLRRKPSQCESEIEREELVWVQEKIGEFRDYQKNNNTGLAKADVPKNFDKTPFIATILHRDVLSDEDSRFKWRLAEIHAQFSWRNRGWRSPTLNELRNSAFYSDDSGIEDRTKLAELNRILYKWMKAQKFYTDVQSTHGHIAGG